MKVLSMLSRCAGLLAAALALGGCTDQTVKKVEQMADRACACSDAACADKVEKEFWEFAKAGQKRGTQSERDEVEAHYTRMRECIVKLRSEGQPPSASGAAAPASPSPAAEAGK